MKSAPLIVFAYNRLNHLKTTLEKLNHSPLAPDTDFFIFSDHYKLAEDVKKIENVRKYIKSFRNISNFKSMMIIEAVYHKGLAQSVITGVSKIISEYKKVIVVEDDLLTADDFLDYMNSALNFYQNNPHIWSISGYTFPMKSLINYQYDVYPGYRASSWGWATWQDRWETVDWSIADYPQFKFNLKMRGKMNRGGPDMADMLDKQMRGEIDSWAIRWCYQQSKADMLTIFPKISRVKNIGTDGSGTHSRKSNQFDTPLYADNKKCNFENVNLNDHIVKEFKKKFTPPPYEGFKRHLKSILLRIK